MPASPRLLAAVLVFTALAAAVPAAASPVTDSLTHYYAARDAEAIARLHRQAADVEERLLCSYRLFALTRDDAWLRDLPGEDALASARGLALLSAHWAFRAANAPAWRLPIYGRRSEAILRRAQTLDAEEPYVLLVEGQSLYYKPALFGGDVAAAEARFERLREVIREHTVPGLHPFEADVWVWMAQRKRHDPAAEALRARLLAQQPPPLFRQFLLDPP